MELSVGHAQYENAEQCLRDLMRMIRVGFPLDDAGKPQGHKKQIAETISALKKEMATKHGGGEIERLRLLTLEGEYYQQCGKHVESSKVLEPVWKELRPRVEQWSVSNPLEPKKDRRLLRQKIWALMHYVFYHYYRVTAQHKEALEWFLKIEKIICNELETHHYHPFGTLALCNYFIGLCYRVNRGFVEAERRMLAAQRYTHERVTHELKRKDISSERKKYELDYKDLVCARILSGMGWIALQQGHLVRAEQHLFAAQNCMAEVRQETIGVFVDSLLLIARRRRTAYDENEYEEILEQLEQLYKEASLIHELTRQRCAFELVRGYLDLAEFGSHEGASREDYLKEAQRWLGKVADLESAKAKQRFHLHKARLLLVKGERGAAQDELKKAAKGVQTQRAVLIMEAALYLSEGDFDNARATADKALRDILPLSESGNAREYRLTDPVLEAECYIILARVCAAKRDYPGARHYLGRWKLLGQFVENYYLHHLARKIVTTQLPFFLEYEYPIYDRDTNHVIMTIVERRDAFERWLVKNAVIRYPDLKQEELADIYGMERSTFSRRFGSPDKIKKVMEE